MEVHEDQATVARCVYGAAICGYGVVTGGVSPRAKPVGRLCPDGVGWCVVGVSVTL
jgi:hypothetical protein